jgi:hypothetical protein
MQFLPPSCTPISSSKVTVGYNRVIPYIWNIHYRVTEYFFARNMAEKITASQGGLFLRSQ